eukprot:GFYU01000828.1.p1 GENE.GFYU01000828.1~~GFYU01000828.1.p1  ORF type:complete len:620 (+),score=116.36 GFYU01000828.1:195-2054(+)
MYDKRQQEPAKVLFYTDFEYPFFRGGAVLANVSIVQGLSQSGHDCRVYSHVGAEAHREVLKKLAQRGISYTEQRLQVSSEDGHTARVLTMHGVKPPSSPIHPPWLTRSDSLSSPVVANDKEPDLEITFLRECDDGADGEDASQECDMDTSSSASDDTGLMVLSAESEECSNQDNTDFWMTIFTHNGVDVRVVTTPQPAAQHLSKFQRFMTQEMAAFQPDVCFMSPDFTYACASAARTLEIPTLYLVHSLSWLPFSPFSFETDEEINVRHQQHLQRMTAVVTPSNYLSEHARTYSRLNVETVRIPLPCAVPKSGVGDFDNKYVTMFNPTPIKGGPIFFEIAKRCPDVKFAAVPMWATRQVDLEQCASLANVDILEEVDNVTEIFEKTKVLLVPSLIPEPFPLVIMEALLHGVPVIAANAGGLSEAALWYESHNVCPVTLYNRRELWYDEDHDPPVQDSNHLDEWESKLTSLLGDKERYERASVESRQAALRYMDAMGNAQPFHSLIEDLAARGKSRNRGELIHHSSGDEGGITVTVTTERIASDDGEGGVKRCACGGQDDVCGCDDECDGTSATTTTEGCTPESTSDGGEEHFEEHREHHRSRCADTKGASTTTAMEVVL